LRCVVVADVSRVLVFYDHPRSTWMIRAGQVALALTLIVAYAAAE
jgi:hypothetical protein